MKGQCHGSQRITNSNEEHHGKLSERPWRNEKGMAGALSKKRSLETLVRTVSIDCNGQKLD